MSIFKITNTKLALVKEEKFRLEKDLQSLVENNLETLFGLELICSEFTVSNLRIDTLAFDPESLSFVVIEYKRGSNFSVIDQGFSYLSQLMRNKAEFVLELNKRAGKNCIKSDIDWSQSRVLFVAEVFTRYQREAINFRDLPLELWQVQKFEDGLVSLDRIEPSSASGSMVEITKNSVVSQVVKEVKSYVIDDHFGKDWGKSRGLFDSLAERVLEQFPALEVNPVKTYIGFKEGRKNIFAVKPQKEKLVLELGRTRPQDLTDPEGRATYVKNSFKNYNQHLSQVGVKSEDDIDYSLMLLRQVYKEFHKLG